MTAAPMIPAGWVDVTPAWMTTALRASYPGVEVSDVKLVLRDDGTNRRARFRLMHAGAPGPGTVFVKAADPDHAELNARTGGIFNEPKLFRSDVSLPLDHPQVHLSLIDEPTLDFVMVMEDIAARGGDPRDATRPMSVDQAADGVRGLARLHRRFWGERLDAEPGLDWVEPFVAWTGMHRAISGGLARVGASVQPEVGGLAGEQIEHQWFRYAATLTDGPLTLLHGDAHIGNTYVLPGDRVGFLDWQVLRRGNHVLDLGYFLQGALTVDDRRTSEAELIDEYVTALDLPAGEAPTRDDVWLRYRASATHGLALWMATASGDWQRPEVSLALVQRYASAFVDLDTSAALDDLERS